MLLMLLTAPFHSFHQCHLVRGRGDVKGWRLPVMTPMFESVHRLLLLHLHCVAQTQGPEKKLLSFLWGNNSVQCCISPEHVHLHITKYTKYTKRRWLTLLSGPGEVSIMSIPTASGISWSEERGGWVSEWGRREKLHFKNENKQINRIHRKVWKKN